jgi:hypothetical protein
VHPSMVAPTLACDMVSAFGTCRRLLPSVRLTGATDEDISVYYVHTPDVERHLALRRCLFFAGESRTVGI